MGEREGTCGRLEAHFEYSGSGGRRNAVTDGHGVGAPPPWKVCLKPEDNGWKSCKDWRAVNPFQAPPAPKVDAAGGDAGDRRAPTPAPMGRPTELRQNEREVATRDAPAAVEAPPMPSICQQLDPKQAPRPPRALRRRPTSAAAWFAAPARARTAPSDCELCHCRGAHPVLPHCLGGERESVSPVLGGSARASGLSGRPTRGAGWAALPPPGHWTLA